MRYNYEFWKHDLLVRISHITQYARIEKLKQAKNKLEQFMSEDDRLSLILKELDELV